MTTKDRENKFIERCRKQFGVLSWEAELLLRHGFAAGAEELGHVAFAEGVFTQQDKALRALGATFSPPPPKGA